MKEITLGKTGIKTPQNAFGALPIQRVTMDEAVKILQRAYKGGMTFFDRQDVCKISGGDIVNGLLLYMQYMDSRSVSISNT